MIPGGDKGMKLRWLWVVALGLAAMARPGWSQVSFYGDMSASMLTGGLVTTTTSILYGPTIGMTAQIFSRSHLKFYGDIRGGFYGGSQRLDQVGVGPKIGFAFKKYEAYGEFIAGFGRYNSGQNVTASASTDSLIELNGGLDRQITSRLDWRVVDFGYEQYYGLGGEFNPKTFSTGVVVHLTKR